MIAGDIQMSIRDFLASSDYNLNRLELMFNKEKGKKKSGCDATPPLVNLVHTQWHIHRCEI